jgi:hypothetical protein
MEEDDLATRLMAHRQGMSSISNYVHLMTCLIHRQLLTTRRYECRCSYAWSAGDVYDGDFKDHIRHGSAT